MSGLDAAGRMKLRRLVHERELAHEESGGELNVVPFLDIIVNVLIFVLATIAVTFTASLDVKAPSLPGFGHKSEGLRPTLMVVNEGFAIKTASGNVSSGCEAVGAGVAVPKRGGDYDYVALGACMQRLKQEAGLETQAFVTANPTVEYQVIIAVLDAVRATPAGEPLFPDVSFQVPR